MLSPTKVLHSVYEKLVGFEPMAGTTVNEVRGYIGLEPAKTDKYIRIPEDLLESWRREFEVSHTGSAGDL